MNKKSRWFVLTTEDFNYYTSPKKEELKGSIVLTTKDDVTVEQAKGLEFKSKERQNCLKINVKSLKKEYIIDAQNPVEMQAWIRVINHVLEGKVKRASEQT